MITISDLGNEAFRKFLNLASDCALQFTKKKNPNSSHGSVSLYFGDASSLQMSLQKLSLLPTLAGNACIRGIIKCMEIRTEEQRTDQPKYSLLGRMTFQFNAEKADRLRQLHINKDRKNEGTKKKSAQVRRIHSAMNQEMLILLFPFSLNVHISEVDHPMKGVKG
uniref:Uncharacterized protein n=1 Tax=Biomphalaria glabrata TaxID=6526 RepID=A0A2C9LH81_BIOGL